MFNRSIRLSVESSMLRYKGPTPGKKWPVLTIMGIILAFINNVSANFYVKETNEASSKLSTISFSVFSMLKEMFSTEIISYSLPSYGCIVNTRCSAVAPENSIRVLLPSPSPLAESLLRGGNGDNWIQLAEHMAQKYCILCNICNG